MLGSGRGGVGGLGSGLLSGTNSRRVWGRGGWGQDVKVGGLGSGCWVWGRVGGAFTKNYVTVS